MKKYSLSITDDAVTEINQAYLWYEDKSNGLGERFLDSLDYCFNSVIKAPKIFQKIYKKQRQAIVHNFPYVVIYEIIETEIVVYAVFNTHLNPNKKIKH